MTTNRQFDYDLILRLRVKLQLQRLNSHFTSAISTTYFELRTIIYHGHSDTNISVYWFRDPNARYTIYNLNGIKMDSVN